MNAREQLGRDGEQRAADYLRERGWEILDRNWRSPRGELDIVARDPDGVVVFCEVKTRSSTAYGQPAEAVTRDKLRCLRRAACDWLRVRAPHCYDVRFDVLTVSARDSGVASVEHLLAVF
jgi:putative endonuclease